MAAWFAGDFEGCIALCDSARRRDSGVMRTLALLKTRALLRLDKPHEALQALRPLSYLVGTDDESLTARMLEGSALVRFGKHDEGLALLQRAQREGTSSHSTIRSEIALNIALAYYAKREFRHAENALAGVDIGADIVHARALEYSGWIAGARGETERATDLFISALERLDLCKHYDRFLEANCLRKLAHLAVERLDRATWSLVEERQARLDRFAGGLSWPRFWIAYCAATYACDFDGDIRRAARAARSAQQIAPNRAARVQALCKRAAVLRNAGDLCAPHDHAEDAATVLDEPGDSDSNADDVMVHLLLAEEFAHLGRHHEAAAHLSKFRQGPPTSRVISVTNEPSTLAQQRYVEGRIQEGAGELVAAKRAYGEAIQMYTRIGYKRRAVMASLRLAQLSGDAALYDYADAQTRDLAPQSWIRRTIAKAHERPVHLTKTQEEIVALICQGKSNPEIARLRNRSENTVRNHIAKIFERLGVNSREEVAVQAVLRGFWQPRAG